MEARKVLWLFNFRVEFQNMNQEFVVKLDVESLNQEIEPLNVSHSHLLILQYQVEVEEVFLIFNFAFHHISLREYVLRVCNNREQASLPYVVINL
jgi:hypothetical protein